MQRKLQVILILSVFLCSINSAHAISTKLPAGWEVIQSRPASIEVMASKNNDASLFIAKEAKEQFDVSSLREFQKIKVGNFETTYGISNLSALDSIKIHGHPAFRQSFEVNVPDRNGINIPMLQYIYTLKKGDYFYTIGLSARTKRIKKILERFREYYKECKFEC